LQDCLTIDPREYNPWDFAEYSMRKVKYRAAMSLDGFIADANGDVEWLHRFHAEHGRKDYGLTEFFRSVDSTLMGRRTHDFALRLGKKDYPGMEVFVFTRTKPPGKRDGVEYVSSEPAELIASLRKKSGKDIWLCGGGDLAAHLLRDKLVDEISVAVVPLLLGDGIPLFQKGYPLAELQLINCTPWETGVVVLSYAATQARRRAHR
jgi:dihydrofolate reductase